MQESTGESTWRSHDQGNADDPEASVYGHNFGHVLITQFTC